MTIMQTYALKKLHKLEVSIHESNLKIPIIELIWD